MAMLEITATTGRTTITSCASMVSAIKNSASVAIKVSLTISLMDVVSLYCMTGITSPGFIDHVFWRYAQENIERQKPITEMTASDG
jgi:hypothetical protein